MCKNVLKNTIKFTGAKKVDFFIRLSVARAAKRTRLWVAQDGKCHYCQRETVLPKQGSHNSSGLTATLDHIITQSNGGTDSLANMVVACNTCNNNRSDMDYEIFYSLMTTPGGWEEHMINVRRAKAERDEARREEGHRRHLEHNAQQQSEAHARWMERFMKHTFREVLREAKNRFLDIPTEREEQVAWAMNYHKTKAVVFKECGPGGKQLLSNWMLSANFGKTKFGRETAMA